MQKEKKARKVAIGIILTMIGIWIILSVFSFVDSPSRERPQTVDISFNNQSALHGKQVFQAYNCMDCHTIVGNGAYFAPDLTKTFEENGPAWLRAYLGSPGTFPTGVIVNVNFQQMKKDGLVREADFETYLKDFPGAKRRIENRSGVKALMPNLGFKSDEIDALIAFFEYTAKINTGGWPPKVIADPAVIDREARTLEQMSGLVRPDDTLAQSNPQPAGATSSAIENGKLFSAQLGCTACHSDDGSKVIGPTFKGLFGSSVSLEDGSKVSADEQYLQNSILHPNDQVVKGYPKGVMPSFDGVIKEGQLSDIISYIKSLK